MQSLANFNLPYRHENIGTGDSAIYNTVSRMKEIIHLSSANPFVRRWSQEALAHVPVNSKWDEANAIYRFVRDNVRYTKDPYGIEYIQTPPTLLEGIHRYRSKREPRPIGDCDDMTTLSLSMLKSVGFPVAIRTVGFTPDRFSHVYGLVNVDGQWTPIDTVRPDKWLGWEAPNVRRAMELEV